MEERQCSLENMELIRQGLDPSFWQGKRVLLTGHSGFKGSWLVLWLSRLGAEVTGISLRPNTSPNLFNEANLHEYCDSNSSIFLILID